VPSYEVAKFNVNLQTVIATGKRGCGGVERRDRAQPALRRFAQVGACRCGPWRRRASPLDDPGFVVPALCRVVEDREAFDAQNPSHAAAGICLVAAGANA